MRRSTLVHSGKIIITFLYWLGPKDAVGLGSSQALRQRQVIKGLTPSVSGAAIGFRCMCFAFVSAMGFFGDNQKKMARMFFSARVFVDKTALKTKGNRLYIDFGGISNQKINLGVLVRFINHKFSLFLLLHNAYGRERATWNCHPPTE